MNASPLKNAAAKLLHVVIVAVGAAILTLALFLVLPIIQTLSKPPTPDTLLTSVDTALLEPPPPPPEEEEPEEPEEEEKPPELVDETPPLDLSQLELALNPGTGDGLMAGDFAINLAARTGGGSGDDGLFSIGDLDQKPRVIFQPGPTITNELRKRAPGSVQIIFIVDEQGRTTSHIVQNSSDPIFERAALDAVRKWKFEPGKRNGKPVRFRMRVPITFPEGI